jgi:hypothetical protein
LSSKARVQIVQTLLVDALHLILATFLMALVVCFVEKDHPVLRTSTLRRMDVQLFETLSGSTGNQQSFFRTKTFPESVVFLLER